MKQADVAYAAGIIDGEGCIAVRKTKSRGRNYRNTYTYYYGSVVVVNTNKPMLMQLKKWFGGSVQPRTKVPRCKPTFQWMAGSHVAMQCLLKVLPHLRIKKQEAKLVIRLQRDMDRHRSYAQRSKRVAFRESLWRKSAELKGN